MYLQVEQAIMIAIYTKCFIIKEERVSANLFPRKSDKSLSLKNYLHKYNVIFANFTGFQIS